MKEEKAIWIVDRHNAWQKSPLDAQVKLDDDQELIKKAQLNIVDRSVRVCVDLYVHVYACVDIHVHMDIYEYVHISMPISNVGSRRAIRAIQI